MKNLFRGNVRKFTAATVIVLAIFGVGYSIWQHNHNKAYQAGIANQKAVLFSRDQSAGPLQQAYQQKVQASLASDQPIIPLDGLDGDKTAAQNAAVARPDMQAAAHDKDTGQALRAQVFQINAMPQSSATGTAADCKQNLRCYIVEIYFFANNSTGKVTVGVGADNAATVLTSDIIAFSQPELPKELTDITKELITGSQELKDTLHETVDVNKLTMVNGKTALKATRCERSEHLCVAPTMAEDDEAYWIIVDMTDNRIVGVTWTYWKDKVPDVPPSEQSVIDAAITQKYCGVDNSYDADGWKFNYTLTGSDGLEVKQVSYKGVDMIASAKNPDWHVSYSHQQGFGYSDAVGCPVFSTAAVVPATEPKFTDIKDGDGNKVGFELVQEFKSKLWPQPCNYYYQQRFQFFDDGSFRPAVVNLGRGCGDDGTYRPVTRIQPAATYTRIDQWDGSKWQAIAKEEWEKDSLSTPLPVTDSDARYQLTSRASKLNFILGRGQFNDGGQTKEKGDNAWVYINRFHPDKDEGSSDMATLGSCCNLDFKQGPDTFTNNEQLANSPLLLWYVSEQKNSATPGEEYCWANAAVINGVYKTNTFPCVSGPKLQLVK